jgi:hypothetical protein
LADEALAKHYAECSKLSDATTNDYISRAENPSEAAAIEAGNRRGAMNIQAFDKSWGSGNNQGNTGRDSG